MDAPLTSLADDGPLAAALLADALLEQTWLATAPETWFASPMIVVFTCAFAMAMRQNRPHEVLERLTAAVRGQLGAGEVIGMALRELRALAGARHVVVAIDGVACPTLVFSDPPADARTGMPAAEKRASYFFGAQAARDEVVMFDTSGAGGPAAFRAAHGFNWLTGFDFQTREWHGRLLLLDPARGNVAKGARRQFAQLLRQLVPATARVCDLHAQRHRAAERERARLGRELHDGILQELTCLDMELELIGVATRRRGLRTRIGRIQERLRAEASTLRMLLQDARFRDLDATRLQAVLEAMVRRFGRDTRVHADYVSHVTEVRLPPQVCGEIARIVQEALVNVRRHSGARHVVVTFSCNNADWKLSIQDDGRGFGAHPQARTDAGVRTALPPAVIHERVHSLGGTVRVIAPGSPGARIEISAPQRGVWKPMA
jgi:signal transduction histidine kinase